MDTQIVNTNENEVVENTSSNQQSNMLNQISYDNTNSKKDTLLMIDESTQCDNYNITKTLFEKTKTFASTMINKVMKYKENVFNNGKEKLTVVCDYASEQYTHLKNIFK